jgi:hypothetical protein
MSGANPARCSFLQPVVGSRFDYLVEGFKVLDSELAPNTWDRPIEITADMHPVVQAHFKRWNPLLQEFQTRVEAKIIEQLRDVGVPAESLLDPLDENVKQLITSLTDAERLRLDHNTSQEKPGALNAGKDHRSVCTRVITAVLLSPLGKHSYEKTAEYLNLDVRDTALSRQHIGRAFKAERQRWRRSGTVKWLREILIFGDNHHVQCLDVIFRQAKPRAEFKFLRGAELAAAIHGKLDLAEYVHRADRYVAA